mmetsp:Transcript_8243/g.17617  ORF Transcript_8243/g.17617 Transcript_8243/m.17617 type:complete len:102 (+) Transcript_8243:5024-5329(+)
MGCRVPGSSNAKQITHETIYSSTYMGPEDFLNDGSLFEKQIILYQNKIIIHQSFGLSMELETTTESKSLEIHAGNDLCLNILGLFSIHRIFLQWEFVRNLL